MLKTIARSLLILIILIIITGIAYPLLITGISKIAFHNKSSGSLIYNDGKLIGSGLVGQDFKGEGYFHPRPSFAGQQGYDALRSQGSNYAASNEKFLAMVRIRVDNFRKENQVDSNAAIPADIVTASGSGLDPHISIESALLQVSRIASARNISPETLRLLVIENGGRQYGFIGEPVVNVLKLNLLLDNMK
ncbi:MAG: potassium-transporting ATPase subunit KdpC [Actinobacteria bacterium]|nr:potassium-transporting ATPase subunit KdpC [Actinomycetota bacterium]MCL5069876.1 potassium-transporting ATPase subunit KdpC [Actinomycetota bacterium]